MSLLRRVRATFSIGLFWGIAWAGAGLALGAGRVRFVGPLMLSGVTVLGICGTVAAIGFALALSRAERNRDVVSLSARRTATWGASGGAVAGLVATLVLGSFSMPIVAIGAGIMGTMGSASAVATVRVARGGALTAARERLDATDVNRLED